MGEALATQAANTQPRGALEATCHESDVSAEGAFHCPISILLSRNTFFIYHTFALPAW